MHRFSFATFGELLIEGAYAKLVRLPKRPDRPRMLPLARVGDQEVWMVESPGIDASSLFWVEMFDGDDVSADGCSCNSFDDGVAALGAFVGAGYPPPDQRLLINWNGR